MSERDIVFALGVVLLASGLPKFLRALLGIIVMLIAMGTGPR
jgi:hypothetical protein